MRNVLSLESDEARKFFLKEENYFTFDLPPYFEFKGLLENISNKINNTRISDFYDKNLKPEDSEDVNYKLISNKDGKYAWRPLQLIHPALYVYMVHLITEKDNWNKIKTRLNLLIKSSKKIECESLPVVSNYYKKGKAAQIVQWSTEVEKKSIIYSLEFDYLFHTDIVDCYSSIYTHTISWAIHDKNIAKKERGNKKLIGNLIDWQLQAMSNGQTNGVPQGSTLMDFLAEIVLCYVDSLLSEKIKSFRKSDYQIIRYRDDYRIFSNSPQLAEQIIKDLADILNEFGMKINPSKTRGLNNVIQSSIKQDKTEWIVNKKSYNDLQSELYAILVFSELYPNSGTVSVRLKDLYDKLLLKSKKDKKGNIKVLVSIATDIAFKNPRTYPIVAAILSKLIDFLPKTEKKKIVKKIINKFNKLPNTGIMQLWLQRITIKIGGEYYYSEKLCKKVVDKNTVIWNSNWLRNNFRRNIDMHSIINNVTLEELGAVISNDEVELFKVMDYPY